MGRYIRKAILGAALAISAAWADGSVSTSELLQSLGPTNPQLVQTLRDGFNLDKGAIGTTIGRAVNPELSGTRIGPYTIHARLKQAGQSGLSTELVIVLKTDVTFLDAQKHKTDKPAAAVSVKETLKSIEIQVVADRARE
ncbi:MAG TPA: hypothetical protein VKU19_30815 [Bryobacteraceae bacterium]|nr:hypothetical protein [Bryobacteraceae bacterium]